MDDRFVNAYARDTGQKHRIPRHWLDHPTLSKRWRKTPKQRDSEAARTSATPSTDVTATTPANPPTTETPAAGAKE